jgi:hypothetical protein
VSQFGKRIYLETLPIKLPKLDPRKPGRGIDPAIAFESASHGLEGLFSRLNYNRRIKLLDLGPPNQALMEGLRGLPISLFIGDLLSEIGVDKNTSLNDQGKLQQLSELDVQRSLRHVDGFAFDAVLGWDYGEYLDAQSMANLLRFVSRVSRKGTQFHCLTFRTKLKPAAPSRYSVTKRMRLCYQPLTERLVPTDERCDSTIQTCLPGFEIADHYGIGEVFREHVYVMEKKAGQARLTQRIRLANAKGHRP